MGYALIQKKHDWDAAWHLFVVGATHEDISEKLGIPHSAIIDYSRTHDWSKRRITAREVASKIVKEDLIKRIEQNRAKHQHFVMDQLEESEEHISQLIVKKQYDSPFAIGMPLGQKLSILKQHDDIARRTYKLDEIQEHDPIRQGFALLVALQPNKPIVNEKTIEAQEIQEGETLVSSDQDEFVSGEGNCTKSEPVMQLNSTDSPAGNSENVVELGTDFIPVKPLETTPSGMEVLPGQSEPFAGILSPLNGHINGPAEVQEGMVETNEGLGEQINTQNPGEEPTAREWQIKAANQEWREAKNKETPPATVEQIEKGIKPLPRKLF